MNGSRGAADDAGPGTWRAALHRPLRITTAVLELAGAALASVTAVVAFARLGPGQGTAFAAVAVVLVALAVGVLRGARWALVISIVGGGGQVAGVIGTVWELVSGIDAGKAGLLRLLGVDPTVGVVIINLVYSALATVTFPWWACRQLRLRHRRDQPA